MSADKPLDKARRLRQTRKQPLPEPPRTKKKEGAEQPDADDEDPVERATAAIHVKKKRAPAAKQLSGAQKRKLYGYSRAQLKGQEEAPPWRRKRRAAGAQPQPPVFSSSLRQPNQQAPAESTDTAAKSILGVRREAKPVDEAEIEMPMEEEPPTLQASIEPKEEGASTY